MTAKHWTQELRDENAALRQALELALLALRTIPQSRLTKAHRCPDQDPCCDLAYVTCAREVDNLGVATIQEISVLLAESEAL
jgi:hypothetical protein